LGLISFIIVTPLVFFLFRGATDKPRRSDPIAPIAPIVALSGVAAREGMKSPAFLKLAGAVLVFGLAGSGVTANGVPILRAQGFGAAEAAGLAGLIGIGSI